MLPQAHARPLSSDLDLLGRGCSCSHLPPSALVSLCISSLLSSLSRPSISPLVASLSRHLVVSSLNCLVVSFPRPIAPSTPRLLDSSTPAPPPSRVTVGTSRILSPSTVDGTHTSPHSFPRRLRPFPAPVDHSRRPQPSCPRCHTLIPWTPRTHTHTRTRRAAPRCTDGRMPAKTTSSQCTSARWATTPSSATRSSSPPSG